MCQWLKSPRDPNTVDRGQDEINKEKQLLYPAIAWFINDYVFNLIKVLITGKLSRLICIIIQFVTFDLMSPLLLLF